MGWWPSPPRSPVTSCRWTSHRVRATWCTAAVTWADGTSFSHQFTRPVLDRGDAPTAEDTAVWDNFAATTATQTFGTEVLPRPPQGGGSGQ